MFDCVPSDIQEVYWKYTQNDIKVKLRLHLANEQAHITQDFQTIALIVSQAFGDGKKSKGTKGGGRQSDAFEPTTAEEMRTAFKNVFG